MRNSQKNTKRNCVLADAITNVLNIKIFASLKKERSYYQEFINETDTNILSEINTEIVRLKTFELNQTECLQKIKKMFNNAYYKIKKQLKKQQLDV